MKRIIDTNIWEDDKLSELPITTKLVWLYLLSCPKSQAIGIFHLPIRNIAYHTNLSDEIVKDALLYFQENKMAEYSEKTQEILIYNYVRYNIIKITPNIEYMIKRELGNIKDKDLIVKLSKYITDNINNYSNNNYILNKILSFCNTHTNTYTHTNTNTNTNTKDIDTTNTAHTHEEQSWDELVKEINDIKNE